MIKTRHYLLAFIPAVIFVIFLLTKIDNPFELERQRVEQYLQAQQKQSETGVIALSPTDPIIGQRNAPKQIIAFADLGCESCKEQNTFINDFLDVHGETVKIIWKGLSVTRFPYPSDEATYYAFCAHKQGKFELFKEYAYANNENLSPIILEAIAQEIGLDIPGLETCLATDEPEQKLAETQSLALSLGIESVPALFYNNKPMNVPNTLDAWEQFLEIENE